MFRVSRINPKQKNVSSLSSLFCCTSHEFFRSVLFRRCCAPLSLVLSLLSLLSLTRWLWVLVLCCGGLLIVCFGRKFRERERERERDERDEKSKIGIEGSDARRAREEADADDFDADWIAEGDFF